MLGLALQGIRGRRATFAGAFVALFFAALLVTASGVLLASALRANAPAERYAGTPVVVAGQQVFHRPNAGEAGGEALLPERARVPVALQHRLAGLAGVRAAIADVAVPTAVIGVETTHDTLLHGWSSAALTPLTLASGRAPERPGEAVLDAGLGVRRGTRVRLAAVEPARVFTVVGITRETLRRQSAVFVTDAEARRMAGHPRSADAIGLLLAPGTDPAQVASAARRVAGGAAVLTGDKRGGAEFLGFADAREGMTAIMGLFGALALVIAVFVVAGTLGLAVQLRERELALLRVIAATPAQIRWMLRWEAIVLALAAAATAYFPGAALAGVLNQAFAARGIAPEGIPLQPGPIPALVTLATTLVAALAAAWAGSRRASRVAPTRALQDAAVEPRVIGRARLLAGLAALAGGGVSIAVSGSLADQDDAIAAALAASLALVAAAGLLGPVIARLAAFFPGRLVARLSPASGFLAVAATRTAPRRIASAMTPIVLTVALAGTLLFSDTTLEHATAQQAHERQIADLALHDGGLGVPGSVIERALHTPGVTAAVGIASTGVVALDDLGSAFAPMPAQMVDGADAARVLDLDVRSGRLSDLRGHTVALDAHQAAIHGIKIGDRIPLALGDGTPVRLTVVATYGRALGFGTILLPRELAAPHATDPLPEAVLIRTDRPGVADRLRHLQPGITVATNAELHSAEDVNRRMRTWLSRVLVALIFAFTAIAAVNTLAMIAFARRSELAVLRLVGATPRQIARMSRWEAVLVVMVGIGLGAAITLASLLPFSATLAAAPYVPLAGAAGLVAVTAALGMLASQLPTRIQRG